jgi:hypothetical protein
VSDVSEGSGPIPRRSPRTSDGGAPVSGALAIVLAVIAVVAGFFILRSISGDDEQQLGIPTDAATGDGDESGEATTDGSAPASTASPLPTSTVAAPLTIDGATVVVANANGVGGSAATMSRALEAGPGFTMGEPTDASSATGVLDVTVIYYDTAQPAAQAVADSVNRSMGGGATLLPLPAGTPPVASGDLGGAGVLVMLGTDKANKTLEELNPTTDTAPVVVTNPPLSSVAE